MKLEIIQILNSNFIEAAISKILASKSISVKVKIGFCLKNAASYMTYGSFDIEY